MSIHTLLEDLQNRGVILCPEGNRLNVDAPKGVITPAILSRLKKHKVEIIAFLSSQFEREALRRLGNPAERSAREAEIPMVCFVCGGGFWWASIHGNWVCLTCHSPARADLVYEWQGPFPSEFYWT